MKARKRFDEDKLSLIDYLKRTVALDQSAAKNEREWGTQYPHITLLLFVEKTKNAQATERVKNLDAKALFKEIHTLEGDLAQTLLTSPRDRKLFSYHKRISLIQRLSEIFCILLSGKKLEKFTR